MKSYQSNHNILHDLLTYKEQTIIVSLMDALAKKGVHSVNQHDGILVFKSVKLKVIQDVYEGIKVDMGLPEVIWTQKDIAVKANKTFRNFQNFWGLECEFDSD